MSGNSLLCQACLSGHGFWSTHSCVLMLHS